MKTIHFISGMPRSGAHLLINIMVQNPVFYPGYPTGLIDVMFQTRNNWSALDGHRKMDSLDTSRSILKDVLYEIMHGYYKSRAHDKIVLDLERGWLSHIEMLNHVLGEPVKILVPVRNLLEVLASFELVWRRESRLAQTDQEKANYIAAQTVAGRCEALMGNDGPVGLAYNRVADALQRGYKKQMHFVHYERLTSNPAAELAAIYAFLGHDYFDKHDFGNVKQVTTENEQVHGIAGLHKIRPEVKATVPKSHVLGAVAQKYRGVYPWDAKA